MEIRVFPRGYNLVRSTAPGKDGEPTPVVSLTILDAGGLAVTAIFSEPAWVEFAAFVADPEAAAAKQQARERILSPGGLASTLGKPRRNGPA